MSAAAGQMAGVSAATKEVTHIEIRRVQNGFVVMAVDYRKDFTMDARPMQRAAFVAQDIDTLKTLIENIVNMAEVNWLPTADVPMLDMQRIVENASKQRVQAIEEELVNKVAQRAAHIISSPPVSYAPNVSIGGIAAKKGSPYSP